ncbi:MAG: 30S ribosomal protein THX [Saprospiraceae bacterium]
MTGFIQHRLITTLYIMGRGDFRSKKGKIRRGSHGNTRPKPGKMRAIKRKAALAAAAAN